MHVGGPGGGGGPAPRRLCARAVGGKRGFASAGAAPLNIRFKKKACSQVLDAITNAFITIMILILILKS